TCKK
ncbi:Late transcription factor VLTF-4 (1), partial [Monkeypox virus]